MAYLLYDILLSFFLILSAPYFCVRALFDKRFRRELTDRMGCVPFSSKRPIWVHTASVGEVFCAIPLIKRIKKDYPHAHVFMTTMTRTGHQTARTQVPEAEAVFFFPIDHPLTVRRTMARLQPRLLLIAETELWPTLLRSCGEKGIPLVVFNGRISKKSFPRYRLLKSFFKRYLKPASIYLMQTEEDRKRILEIGAEPTKVKVAGNLKFDQTIPAVTPEGMAQTAKAFGLGKNDKVLIAGSTHEGEEETLLGLYKELKKTVPSLHLLLAPRHLNRLEEVERTLDRESIPWRRKTSFHMNHDPSDRERIERPCVIVLDTMGELMSLYSLGTLVFIGGSLVPVGGHNPLEPLLFRKSVFFGPHMFNFLEVSQGLIEAGGAIQVTGREDLFLHLKRFLSDEGAAKEMGERGFQFLQKHRGATERVFHEIKPFLS